MTLNTRNPRTGIEDYSLPLLSGQELNAICSSLRTHQPAWASMHVEERIEVLLAWKAAVEKHKPALIAALCTDTGRHWETILEADLVASSIDRWCAIAKTKLQTPTAHASSIPFLSLTQGLVPHPLVGVISPWNFPLLLSLIDTIPALLAGSSVIVKPSEVTPRFIAVMQQAIEEVPVLAKVLQYVTGDGSTGAAMVEQADLICFTGSTHTGRKVYAAAAERMIPVFLEMGGKDPAVVLEGADLDAATSAILWGATANAGQSCLSIERVYVQENIMQEFATMLAEKASKIPLAYPDMHEGKIGPIIFEKQVDVINAHLADALSKGARLLSGNASCENLGGGMYCRPTVLADVNHSMRVMTEETFGPIMPLMAFRDKTEALALANGTIYGLSAAVFAATTEEAQAFAKGIEAGAVSINDAALTAVMHEGEKSAFRLSGIGGTRMGPSAIQRFMRQQVLITRQQDVKSPWWYR